MFNVEYSKQATKFLKQAEKALAQRLMKKIESLQTEPFIHDTKVVEGFKEKLYRIRVGDYRILYDVDYENKNIGIVKIDKRENVY